MLFEKLLVGSQSTPPTDIGDLYGASGGGAGQFGNGSTTDITTPFARVNSSLWKEIVSAAGGNGTTGSSMLNPAFSLGIKVDGTLWATGRNANGNLGQGNTTNLTTWTQVGSSTWINIAAFTADITSTKMSSFGIQSNGTLWSWGNNSFHQLGDGTTTQRTSPGQVGSATNWAKVVCAGENGNGGVYGFCLGLRSDGTLWSWGSNVSGATGQGTYSGDTNTPTQIGSSTDWTDIAAGCTGYSASSGMFSLAIKSNGTLWAWGNNQFYQLGDNTTTDQNTPIQIGAATTWGKVFASVTGTGFGIRTDGSLYSWGENTPSGMTAQGSTTGQVHTPTQVGVSTGWLTISTGVVTSLGGGYALAIKTDDTMWAWGTNAFGGFGTGVATSTAQPSPVNVGHFPIWKKASAGGAYGNSGYPTTSLAIRGITPDYSALYTFGSNSSGQTAQNTTSGNTLLPTLAATANYTWLKVAPGNVGAGGTGLGCMALLKDGTLWSWGSNTVGDGTVATGSIGQGSVTLYLLVPTQVGTDTDWVDIAQGTYGGLGLKSDGTMWGWGYDIWGQFGGGVINTIIYTPTKIGIATDWAKIYTNGVVSFAIKTNGDLYTFGNNAGYATGLGIAVGNTLVPTQIIGSNLWDTLSVTVTGAIAIRSNGTAWSWGQSTNGELGQGSGTISTTTPTQVGVATDWVKVACSPINPYSFLIKTAGTLWALGSNTSYQTGLNTTIGNAVTPTQVGVATDWADVKTVADLLTSGGGGIGLKTGKQVFVWGNCSNGMLGTGVASGTEPIPSQISNGFGSANAISIAGNAGPAMVISAV
jgi:alpha-tubulin suppressor-like RCC1 family protein